MWTQKKDIAQGWSDPPSLLRDAQPWVRITCALRPPLCYIFRDICKCVIGGQEYFGLRTVQKWWSVVAQRRKQCVLCSPVHIAMVCSSRSSSGILSPPKIQTFQCPYNSCPQTQSVSYNAFSKKLYKWQRLTCWFGVVQISMYAFYWVFVFVFAVGSFNL